MTDDWRRYSQPALYGLQIRRTQRGICIGLLVHVTEFSGSHAILSSYDGETPSPESGSQENLNLLVTGE